MNLDARQVRSIFIGAVENHPADQWGAYLDKACAGDQDLRQRVDVLLRAHAEANSLLDNLAPAGVATIDEPLRERPGAVIGPYKLLQQIGEGGMGVVYMAEQEQPVRRRVALKVIKPGMDSKQIIARFEAERQALAMMDHVNIARVLDAGATEAGRPYFVMELVHGVPITKYCDDNHLTPRQRLELFVPVCQAIQHAHQKGIIHRDIKPSNVMVTLYDGKPVPKVIDFGVAKATEQKLTERTLFTQYGTMVGTLEYMSPEQAEISALGVDTRGDIYSLGVLLYELLTGSTPLSHMRLKQAAYGEVLRIIKEEEPPKPSARLSGSATLPSVAAQRGLEPVRLTRLVRGELDWIVMKCLEKERSRRYDTANGLGRDLERYLADEAVEACPPSARYRIGKFARKNRPALTTAAALALLLLAGAAVSTWQAVRATRAEAVARLAEQQAVIEKSRADEEAAVAKAVNDFLQNDMLAEAAPDKNARSKKVTVEEVLGRAAARVADKFPTQPLIEAAIRQTIGDTYRKLGDYKAAQPHMERAVELRRRVLGEEHPDTLDSMNSLAALYRKRGQYAKAEPLLVKALEVSRHVLGEEHPDTLNSMNGLGNLYQVQGQYVKAEPLHVMALEVSRRVLGEDHPVTLTFMNNLAGLYRSQGQYAKAEALVVKALEVQRRVLGDEHPDTLNYMNNLAVLYKAQGQFAKAEPLIVKALEVRRRVLGEEHPHTLKSMTNLALLYQAQGQYAKAEPLLVKVLNVQRRVLGEEHPDTLTSMNNLGMHYEAQAQYAKAEPLYVKALEVKRRVLGGEHPDTLISMNLLGMLYKAQGQYIKAEPLVAKALEVKRRVLGEEHPSTLISMNNLAVLYEAQGQYIKAEPLFIKGLEVCRRVRGEEHRETLNSMNNLGMLYKALGQYGKAVPLLVKALEVSGRVLGKEHPDTLVSISNLGHLYMDQGQYAKGETLLREQLDLVKRSAGINSPSYAGALAGLGQNLLQQKKWAEAEPVLWDCLAIREKKESDVWNTFNTKSSLGGALLGQKKYAAAEPQLLAGYEGMKVREAKIPSEAKVRLAEALERLVRLYEAMGKKDKADQWRKKLEVENAAVTPPAKP